MLKVNFHSEHPANTDAFPGGSHQKVAQAISSYILNSESSRVIGLDGEFGSGKSSILHMLDAQLSERDQGYKVWFFDCEQNYQGSIKSHFIELFTDKLLESDSLDASKREQLKANRDVALGREFTYRKKTTSRVSAWALAVLVSLFFSSSSFRELFALTRSKEEVAGWVFSLHWLSLMSPVLTLLVAKLFNLNKKEGDKDWSLLSLFKGSSEDYINEKIEIAKEVTPLDLKKTLSNQLEIVKGANYIVVLDNLDRLPKDSLRSVWSDLEIFTWIAGVKNLSVIVPFCSTKVAKYLSPEQDGNYDSKDFIAKKFPVVFRAPPVIASGWKKGFLDLWQYTFGTDSLEEAEKCAVLLQRHSPMANRLVTPRLQKKFINDIATTASILDEGVAQLTCIAAHYLLCKYNEHPLDELLRVGGPSPKYREKIGDQAGDDIQSTLQTLTAVAGTEIENGWQIQFLQVHFLTTSAIAVAELLDVPLREAVSHQDGEKFSSLTGLFGFWDAFKRHLDEYSELQETLITLHKAYSSEADTWIEKAISIFNAEKKIVTPSEETEDGFYPAIKALISLGLDKKHFQAHRDRLKSLVVDAYHKPITKDNIEPLQGQLSEFDACLDALGEIFQNVPVNRVEYLFHVVLPQEDLQVIKPELFTINNAALLNAHQQIASTENYPFSCLPMDSEYVVPAFSLTYGARRMANGLQGGLEAADVNSILAVYTSDPDNESAALGILLAKEIDNATLNQIESVSISHPTILATTVAAVAYLRTKNVAKLAGLDNLRDIFRTDLFKVCCRATLTTQMIFNAYDLPDFRDKISEVIAWMINSNAVHALTTDWVLNNFTSLVDSVESHGVDQERLLSWYSAWEKHILKAAEDLASQDLQFVEAVFTDDSTPFQAFVSKSVEYFSSVERDAEDWLGVIATNSDVYHHVINHMAAKGECLTDPGAAKASILSVLSRSVADPASHKLEHYVQLNIKQVLRIIGTDSKNVLGTELRTLIYSADTKPEPVALLLAEFGSLIPDVQPANAGEIGVLLALLEYLARNTESEGKAISFLDNKAEQLAKYSYSEEFRSALASVVSKLKDAAPNLYKKFYRKRGFGEFFKSLLERQPGPGPDDDQDNGDDSEKAGAEKSQA
ncbi:P-loop NTPase fold protein [Pseudomonas sp. MBLB4136]|uniref:P-loop NTPase fold protein n=1 Tax=Pseudomonas sp. MBLB4136 TaxID=3451558 RepID=UPI003F75154D